MNDANDWHAMTSDEALARLQANGLRGLTAREASQRLARHGGNVLAVRKEEPWWREALESLSEPLQLLLIAVAVAYFLLGEIEDALPILTVIFAVSAIDA